MPDDRTGDAGPDAPKVPAGAPAAAGSGGGRGRGPKRTPRPEAGSRRSAAPAATGTSNGSGAVSKAKPKPKPAARSKPAASSRAKITSSPTEARTAAPVAPAPSPVPPVVERPQGDDATSVTELPAPIRPVAAPEAQPMDPAAVDSGTGRRRGRRGRRVRRVIRRVELWSVLKLSLVLYTCLYLAVLGALIVVWGLAYSSGQIGNLQDFLADVGLENYRFYGDQMFRACAAIGAVAVLAGTVITVFTAALVNLISEITGGIRLIVIEEDPPARR